ncbi:hypothetical protein L596_002974 [Steinernema carpocapsae]|uniref:TatD related DNase n=1 Tax=Steinernema carpocapsae TaxID=34508 RepID=A0A4U8UQR4_STECR|nr:hypothetical protein L596_002974 [Steinernema carpocapsae]
MIDCHCHLVDEKFAHDIDEVIQRAKANGVVGVVVCAEFQDQFEDILNLSEKYPDFVSPALGIHPVQRNNVSATLDHFYGAEEYFEREHGRLAAIGEVGLDFTPRYIKDEADKAVQREILAKQVNVSNKFDLPLNVHSRSAGTPTIALLIECGAKKVLLHAFSGNVKSARPGIQAGFYFSIPPSFSLKPEEKRELIRAIPLEQLCLETDSPVLGPSKTEQPINLGYSARFIAEIKGLTVEEVVRVTTENALKLFPRLKRFIKV